MRRPGIVRRPVSTLRPGCGGRSRDDRLRLDVMWDRPTALPFVDAKVESVVGDVDAGDLVLDDREQARLDGRALAAGRGEAAEVVGVFPVQAEGDESAARTALVEGEVLIDKVDAVIEIGELDREVLERLESSYAQASGAVDQHILGDDRVPTVELHALEGLVERPGDCRFGH